MRLPLILVAAIGLVACHRPYHAKGIAGPDGQPGWYRIDCGNDQMVCMERAGQTCPGGYETAGATKQKGAYAVPVNGIWIAEESSSHSMLVKCHATPETPTVTAAPAPCTTHAPSASWTPGF